MLTDIRQIKGCQELLQRIAALEEAVEKLTAAPSLQQLNLKILGGVERNTAYEVNDVLFNSDGNKIDFDWFLTCIQAGTTGTDNLVIPADATEGTVIEDGEVKWTISPVLKKE